MKKNMLKIALPLSLFAWGLTACNPEPDESNIYTATGTTVEQYIGADSTLTWFNAILKQAGVDRLLSTYGQYTCFAPNNEGVQYYLDSIYRDTLCLIPHNGLPDHGTLADGQHVPLEWILAGTEQTDSLCNDISRYHISVGKTTIMDMGTEAQSVTTMLGRTFTAAVDTGLVFAKDKARMVLANKSVIISEDNEMVNGVVHKITHVIPRPSQGLADVMKYASEFRIYYEALERTGLTARLAARYKIDPATGKKMTFDLGKPQRDNKLVWFPKECLIKFTFFAVPDAKLESDFGITDFDGLRKLANDYYKDARQWYDYLDEKGITVSEGDDYENEWNTLHMFMAYHLLYAGMKEDELVSESSRDGKLPWNFCNGADPYDYYETFLPHTILKIWEPTNIANTGRRLFINRYRTFNTLTNDLESMGTNHVDDNTGVGINAEITRKNYEADNGNILPIDKPLCYSEKVATKVLNERMRVDVTTILHEMINNGIRYVDGQTLADRMSGLSYDNSRVGLPGNYFDNLVSYVTYESAENPNGADFKYCAKGNWRAWEADQLQGMGKYDFALKLPPVPSGLYELRTIYPCMDRSSMYQFFVGTSKHISSMKAVGLPLDARVLQQDPRVGWTYFRDEDDLGAATDAAMHVRGYMRAPYSFYRYGTTADNGANNCRGESAAQMLRYVIGRVYLRQGDENWLRIRNLLNDDKKLWSFDFFELVPVSVVDSDQYAEDWY